MVTCPLLSAKIPPTEAVQASQIDPSTKRPKTWRQKQKGTAGSKPRDGTLSQNGYGTQIFILPLHNTPCGPFPKVYTGSTPPILLPKKQPSTHTATRLVRMRSIFISPRTKIAENRIYREAASTAASQHFGKSGFGLFGGYSGWSRVFGVLLQPSGRQPAAICCRTDSELRTIKYCYDKPT
jgi:hypothetical protein